MGHELWVGSNPGQFLTVVYHKNETEYIYGHRGSMDNYTSLLSSCIYVF